jgi:hypothetical protein
MGLYTNKLQFKIMANNLTTKGIKLEATGGQNMAEVLPVILLLLAKTSTGTGPPIASATSLPPL